MPTFVVGVGASAGGLEAFKQLLSALPADTGMAFILVQHLDPTHKSLLAELLTPVTGMPVMDASQRLPIQANTVYVITPDTALAVRKGKLELSTPTLHRGVRLPVDHLFRSLAQEFGPASVGIVLSGAGSDGTDGMRAIKSAGGLTIAQEPGSSSQSGMPRSAIDAGAADLVLDIPAMPEALARFATLPESARTAPGTEPENEEEPPPAGPPLGEDAVGRLGALLEEKTDFDLRVYKPATIQRRVFRRMTLSGHDDVDAYIAQLGEDRREQQTLVRDLLISVTDFFRDSEAFAALRTMVVDPLVKQAGAGDTIRVWAPGCATGEEPYSIAMAFLDAIEERGRRISVQVFATDVDQDALTTARSGIYATTAVEPVGQERLQKYFKLLDGRGYQVRPPLRDLVSFAAHDITKDPPFSRMQLVSCRNLLIYLRPDAQEHVLGVLHFALQPEGWLFLGSAESIGTQRSLFTTASKRWRLYRKVGRSKPLAVPRSRMRAETMAAQPADPTGQGPSQRTTPDELARRQVFQARVPPTVVVDQSGAVLFMHGELRPYLRFPDGPPRLDLSALVSPHLATRVRAALYRARRDKETVVALSPAHESQSVRIKLTATPALDLGDDAVILTFEEASDDAVRPVPENVSGDAIAAELEKELESTREDLRNTVEELESSNEELRSSNEESMSMNEELQSANEELEATTEELRSLNEELTTVNAQLREKVEQLEQAHDDLTNFFSSTKIATLFLDEQLCIKRFTPAAEELLRIDHSDENRFVGDIARDLFQDGLIEDARAVLEHLAARSRELRTPEGRWVVRQVLPYRTESRRIEGVVATFTDVTDLKETANRLGIRERQQAVVSRLSLRALEEKSLQTFLDRTVREVTVTLATDFCKVLELQPGGQALLLRAGVGWRDGAVGQVTVEADLNSQAGFTLSTHEPVLVRDLPQERRFTGPTLLTEHGVTSGLSCIVRTGDEVYGVLGAHTRIEREFSPEDAHFLQAIAAVVAGAIHRFGTGVRLALEEAAAKAVAEAKTLAGVVARVHSAMSREFGEGVGELWQPDGEGGLNRTAMFFGGSFDDARVRQEFGSASTPAGDGVIGRVFADGCAEWISALEDGPRFPRAAAARRLGLRAGILLPIADAGTVIGVMAYFSSGPVHADRVLLQSLEQIGRSIGEFVHRADVERRIRATVDQAPVGIADRALDGRWLRVNDRLCQITGYSREELVGQVFSAIVHPDDLARERELLAGLRAGTLDRYSIEKRYVRKDGRAIWVNVGASLVTKPSGEPDYCVVIVEDIGGRKAAEEGLRRSEARFRDVLRHSPVPLILYDDTGATLAISDSWTEFTGYTLEEIPTADAWVERAYRERADDMRALARGVWDEDPRPHRYEHQIWNKNGELRTVLLSAVPLGESPTGRRLRLAAAMDLTEQRRFEHELQLASRQKDEFIAMLSHELRNPLSAVRTATELLRNSGIENPVIERTQRVLDRQTTHMARLLDGLLDISRIIRGKIELDRHPVDFSTVVQDVTADIAERIRASGLELAIHLGDEPAWVVGDGIRLTQVVDNLLTNAFKYTPAPGRIDVRLVADDGFAVLGIRDTGIGIDPQLLPRVFEVFQQGYQNLDRSQGGLGLGLALVRLLVELHGGTVTAESQGAGRGAEFTVRLPLTVAPSQRALPQSPRLAIQRVLIVEDNEDAAEMLQVALEIQGHEVRVATDGDAGIALARDVLPDVVLCDLGLPGGVTGYDVAGTLRGDAATRQIRLVALSGYGRPEDKQHARAAGFDAHLTKPVALEELERLLGRSAAPAAAGDERREGDAGDGEDRR